jgi:hypothetical protein
MAGRTSQIRSVAAAMRNIICKTFLIRAGMSRQLSPALRKEIHHFVFFVPFVVKKHDEEILR